MHDKTSTAWMVRRDGKAIPCVQHIYADSSELDETLYAAEWLYQNTIDKETKSICISLIKSYGCTLDRQNVIGGILKDIDKKPYVFLTAEFINSVRKVIDNTACGDISELSKKVESTLNEEFLRVRYGGLYNTCANSRDIYFRVSSHGFDWFRIICSFLNERQKSIDTGTIVYDEESTGIVNGFPVFLSRTFNKYPISDFMCLADNRVK